MIKRQKRLEYLEMPKQSKGKAFVNCMRYFCIYWS